MFNRAIRYALPVVLLSGAMVVAVQAQMGPLAEKISDKVIEKYQKSTCQQIAANKAAPPDEMQQKAVEQLRKDPQLRQAFLNKVAGPIVNKLFDCGMIP